MQVSNPAAVQPEEPTAKAEVLEATEATVAIYARGLSVAVADLRRGTRGGPRLLLDDVSITVVPGSFVGVIGPSGCGKSTLLKTLVGIQTPSAGAVLVGGF